MDVRVELPKANEVVFNEKEISWSIMECKCRVANEEGQNEKRMVEVERTHSEVN